MSKAILEHPEKEQIDTLICSGLSSREVEKILKSEFGLSVSYKTISLYHKNELNGLILEPTEGSETEGLLEAFDLDLTTIQTLKSELQEGKNGVGTVLHREFAELVAIQIQLTKNALQNHAKGKGRYPSEYVRNLQILTGIMYKNQTENEK
jgi:transposase